MADYWGLVAIGRRMGVAPGTITAWLRAYGFLAYKRKRYKLANPRWYTNDQLIHTWELSRCQQARKAVLERRARAHDRTKSTTA